MGAEPASLTGRATAAWMARQCEMLEAAANAEIRAEIVPDDPAIARAAAEWARKTLDTRTAAAELAERILGIPAEPDDWFVKHDSTHVAHLERDGLSFSARPLLSVMGTKLELGVRMKGSDKPLRVIQDLEQLGAFLTENAPPRTK